MPAAPRLCALLAVLLFVTVPVAAVQDPERTLHLASDIWPPFTDVEGQMRVAIDLAGAALDRAGVPAENVIRTDFAELIRDLEAGEIDGSAALWHTEERERYLVFSKPYLENRLVLLGPKGSNPGAAGFGALAGKRVAIVGSYAYGPVVDRAQGVVLVRGTSDPENVNKLLRGEVDFVLADELVIHHLFEHHGEEARRRLEAGTLPLIERSLHFALRRDVPDAEEIVKRFDAAIREMIADGTYNGILGVAWLLADVDGDGIPEYVLGGKKAGTARPTGSYSLFKLPPPRSVSAGRARYHVDGKSYDSWEQIPTEYRVPDDPETNPRPRGIDLIQF